MVAINSMEEEVRLFALDFTRTTALIKMLLANKNVAPLCEDDEDQFEKHICDVGEASILTRMMGGSLVQKKEKV